MFQGKVVVVTGGARGIGKGIAEAFAHKGARVAVIDIDKPKLESLSKEDAHSSWGCLLNAAA